MLQPDSLHMMQKRHRRCAGIPPVRTGDSSRVGIFAGAARIAKPLAAANAAHHGGGQSPSNQRWTLLDVQLEVRPDAGWIEKPLPFPDRQRIEALLLKRRFETSAVVGSRNRETAGIEESKRAGASQICDVEPSGLLGANRHHGQIEI